MNRTYLVKGIYSFKNFKLSFDQYIWSKKNEWQQFFIQCPIDIIFHDLFTIENVKVDITLTSEILLCFLK